MSLAQALDAVRRKTDDLYATTLDDDVEIVFRLPPIKKAEQYALLLAIAEGSSFSVIIHEHIFHSCIEDSYLKDNQEILAGIVETMAKLILYLSGVGEDPIKYTEEMFISNRNNSNKILGFMQRVICSTFSGYTFEMLDEMNYPRLVSIFIQAEQVLLDQGIIETVYQFEDPNAKKKTTVKSLQDQIKSDRRDFNEYNAPSAPDPRMQQLREEARVRAMEEERKYRESVGG